MNLSNDQSKALKALQLFVRNSYNKRFDGAPTITLGGYAGTGKTTLMKVLHQELREQNPEIKIAYMALTGKAAAVLKSKLEELEPDFIGTIHSYIYHVISDKFGRILRIELNTNPKPKVDLIIVDEASMVTRKIYNDLTQIGIPIIFVGDHGQLPPIGDNFNLMNSPILILNEIFRQALDSPIIRLATAVRMGDPIPYESGLNLIVMPKRDFNQNILINSDENQLNIVATNKQRTAFNHLVAEKLETTSKGFPTKNAKVICLRNNHEENLYNGMLGRVVSDVDEFDEHNLTFIFEPFGEEARRVEASKYSFFNCYNKLPEGITFREIKNQFDFGYAMTCHKAQGSEASRVIIVGSGFGDPEDRRRWQYTAITRAQEELIWVK